MYNIKYLRILIFFRINNVLTTGGFLKLNRAKNWLGEIRKGLRKNINVQIVEQI